MKLKESVCIDLHHVGSGMCIIYCSKCLVHVALVFALSSIYLWYTYTCTCVCICSVYVWMCLYVVLCTHDVINKVILL